MDLPWIRHRLPEALTVLGRRMAARQGPDRGPWSGWADADLGTVAEPEALAYATECGESALSGLRRQALLGALTALEHERRAGPLRRRQAALERAGVGPARSVRVVLGQLRTGPAPGERRLLAAELERAAAPLRPPFVQLVESLAGTGRLLAPAVVAPGAEPAGAAGLARALLDDTDDAWADVAAWTRRELGVEPGEGLAGWLTLLRQPPADVDYPAGGARLEGRMVAEHLGLPPVEVEDPGPGGWPFPWLAAVGEAQVLAAYSRAGGLPDHLAALRLHAAAGVRLLSGPDEPVEARFAPGGVPSSGVGHLAAALVARPVWVSRRLSVSRDRLTDAVRRGSFVRLSELRLEAARVLAEAILLEHGPGREPLAQAARVIVRATGFEVREVLIPVLCRLDGAAAAELGGSALAAHLEPRLRERCDEDWYRNPATGAVVRGALERGRLEGPEAFLASVLPLAGEVRTGDAAVLTKNLLEGL